MLEKRRSFTPEYKEEAAKMVIEGSVPIASVARDIGLNEQTLRNWVNAYRRAHAGEEPPLSVSERARLRNWRKRSVSCGSRVSFWEKPRLMWVMIVKRWSDRGGRVAR